MMVREGLARRDVIRIGTQTWGYDAWVGPFYPSGTRSADYLSMYARAFDTVEVDSTFYAIPSAKTVQGWRARTPDGFVFALKLPREITHERQLRNSGDALVRFLDVANELGPKLGPVLIQLGPAFGLAEFPALAEFLPLLPPDRDFAIEFRQPDWIRDDVIALLRDHRVALVLPDGRWIPRKRVFEIGMEPTADFSYVRWIGPDRSMVDYSRIQVDRSADIAKWADLMRKLAPRVRAIYGYAGNHFAGHSPGTARMMLQALGMPTVAPEQLGEQLTLL